MTERQIPIDPRPFPAEIAGCQIMGAVRVPARYGEAPDLAVLMGRDPLRLEDAAFVVWDAAARSKGWTAYSGLYDLSWKEAVTEFDRRLHDRH